MSEDPVTTRMLRQALPSIITLASLLIAVTLASALYLGRSILVPIALAILLSFVLLPAVRGLRALRVPRAPAVLIVVLLTFGLLGAIGSLIAREAGQLASDLPRYSITLREKATALRTATGQDGGLSGTFSGLIDMADDLGKALQPAESSATTDAEIGTARRPMQVEIQPAHAGVLATLGSVAGDILHPLATTGLILLFTVFILLQREDLRNRAIRLAGSSDLRKTTAAIDDATARLSRFFLVQLALNVGFGIVIGLGLWLIGVPSPILFGVIAGLFRFVPYVGAAIGAVLPLGVAVAVDPGWSMAISVAALFLVLEPIVGHVLEPLLYGHSTGLSPIAVILAATIWTFLWGPIGLVLATPLTVCLVVLGRHVERLWFLDVILGDGPALDPPETFYQRMLAGDPGEAIEQGRQFLKERALVTYFDEVVLGGLRLAEADLARGTLDRSRQVALGESFRTVVERLGRPSRSWFRSSISSEAAATLARIGPDPMSAAVVLKPEDLAPHWRHASPVLCVSSRGVFDETATLMLSQILSRHGLGARTLPSKALSENAVRDQGIAMVCFSYLDPISLSQIRLTIRQTRRAIPGVKIVVGFWRERDPASLDRLRRATSADILVTSLDGALEAALGLARTAPDAPAVPFRNAAE